MSHFSTSFCFSCPWASGAPHGAALRVESSGKGSEGHGHLTGWARRQSRPPAAWPVERGEDSVLHLTLATPAGGQNRIPAR